MYITKFSFDIIGYTKQDDWLSYLLILIYLCFLNYAYQGILQDPTRVVIL